MTHPTSSLTGKVILVTGATDGIGKETARELAERGAKVIVHARTAERGAATVRDLREANPALDLEVAVADLGSLAAVRAMAADVAARFPRLDVLLNNAGILTPQRQVSADGFELTFAVNHLAHFLLTNLLRDALKAAAPARIITVSSNVHRGATLDFADLQMTRQWDGRAAYGQSKLANVLFAYHLADLVRAEGITSNTLHPGVIGTKLLRQGFGGGGASVVQGAATSVFLASDPAVGATTGEYFDNLRAVQSSAATYVRQTQEQLWEISAEMTKRWSA
jgi:retinol dehydrogenase 14